jgi:hypothetical protein
VSNCALFCSFASRVTAKLRRRRSDERLGAFLMKTMLRCIVWGMSVGAAILPALGVVESPATPEFGEVQKVLRENLAGATDESLNRAAVEGLLLALKGRVVLVTNTAPETGSTPAALVLINAQKRFEGGVGYLQVGRVEAGLPAAVSSGIATLSATNKLSGLVLDLRFADGLDYAAAAGTADLFLNSEVPLLNAGQGLLNSQAKTNAIRVPVVALVNGSTRSAAEALAAVLRQTGIGLIVGSRSAGNAGVTRDFKLSSGETLRVLTSPIQLGDAKAIPATGVVPDIEVAVKAEDERAFLADPFAGTNGTNGIAGRNAVTNGTSTATTSKRVRVTEADLVRERRRDGDEFDTRLGTVRELEPEKPAIQDPVLARAVDLLKGLAVVRQGKF